MSDQPFKPFQVTLPGHPDRELTTNNQRRQKHWSVRHEKTQAAREEAKTEARDQLGPEPPDVRGGSISLRILVLYSEADARRLPDLESWMSACKPYIDGIFDYLADGAEKADDAQIESLSISRALSPAAPQTIYRFFDQRSLSDDTREAF